MMKMLKVAGAMKVLSIIGVLFFCFMTESISRQALAVELRATPFISLAGGWDSNLDSSIDNQVSDITFHVFPGIVLSTDILNTTINLTGSLNMQYFVDNPERNTYERSGIYGLNTAQPIHATENLEITPQARYFKSNDLYYRNSSVIGSQSQVLSNQSLPVTATELTEFAAGMNINYNISLAKSLYLNGMVVRDLYSAPVLSIPRTLTACWGTERKYRNEPLSARLSVQTEVFFRTGRTPGFIPPH